MHGYGRRAGQIHVNQYSSYRPTGYGLQQQLPEDEQDILARTTAPRTSSYRTEMAE